MPGCDVRQPVGRGLTHVCDMQIQHSNFQDCDNLHSQNPNSFDEHPDGNPHRLNLWFRICGNPPQIEPGGIVGRQGLHDYSPVRTRID